MAGLETKKWINADDEGNYQASRAEMNDLIKDFQDEQSMQKAISRSMTSAQVKRQIRESFGKTFYFGTFLDSRGRIYYNGSGIAPQGKDTGRGCLMAATPCMLGKEGLRHLKIGVATTWGKGGMDKWTLARRVEAIDGMLASGELRQLVNEALTGEGFTWREAEEPMQFITIAADLIAAIDSGNPQTYFSSVLIGYDATCSGLQILSALAKCPDTAKRVNVLPVILPDGTQKRADVYLDLAQGCNDYSRKCVDLIGPDGVVSAREAMNRNESGDCWAVFWHEWEGGKGIGRGLTKKPCMVYCYGGKKRTFAASIREESGAPWKACMWLASVMYDVVLKAMLPKAFELMQAMQDAAKVLVKAGKAVEFETENGLPFRQAVFEKDKKDVPVDLLDGNHAKFIIYTPKINKETKEKILDNGKNVTAVAPNLVHHFDGLLLQNAVLRFVENGIDTFFTVHDCFYLRAGDWDAGWTILRETFRDTFKGPVIANLWSKLEATSGITLPKPPVCGTLDMASVMGSEFLFS